jgi:hypothetical protein
MAFCETSQGKEVRVVGSKYPKFTKKDIEKARKRMQSLKSKQKLPKSKKITPSQAAGSFAAKLQKKVDSYNKRAAKSYGMYAQACAKQGKKLGEPVDILNL